MTPEKFFDYLEGKLPPAEKERLERALIADPELQREFVSARQVHRGMQRPAGETATTTRAGSRGRQLAAAFAVLVAMNVALGLFYIFQANKPSKQVEEAQRDALRHQLESSVAQSAAAVFTPPTIGMEKITLTAPRDRQGTIAQTIIDAAGKAGGSGTKGLPNDKGGFNVLVIVPASAEAAFRQTLGTLGGPPATASAASPASPDEPVHFEIVLAGPPQ